MTNQRIKILVVEDELLTAENIKIVLESSGYDVLPLLISGEEAVELACRTPPDLILMDIMLAGEMDGIEAAGKIYDSIDIPIIYLTAYSDKQTLERAKIVEPYGYILKPFNEYDLVNTIEMALYKHQAQKQVRREKEINAVLARLSQTLLKSPSIQDISDQVLEQALFLTRSQFGFAAYIDQKNGQLVSPTLSKDIWDKFKKLEGLSGWILKNKQTLISNDLSRDPRSSGTPAGHIPIRNFIGVPALVEEKLVGIAAVANKKGDFEENDAQVMERLATIYALGMQQKQIQDQLVLYQEHLEEMVEARTIELEKANKKLKSEITERKRAEQQLFQADKMVTLGTLVSGVAHEINNPNTFIMMNTPFLQELWQGILPIVENYYKNNGDFTAAGLNYAELIETVPELFAGVLEGAKRIKNIVQELKDFSRQESDEIAQSVDINLVVKSAITLTAPMIRKFTHRFIVHYGEDIPLFPGKFQRLEQVIINLIQNSCHALPDNDKGILISTDFDKETGSIIVKVEDEGRGIESHNLKFITDPFYTTKRNSGGTGLGLSISANIITSHGGTLEFESTIGKGTIATITLPKNKN